jgi:hypothetical protein
MPLRRGAADLIRRLLTAQGALDLDDLVTAAVSLASLEANRASGTKVRIRSVLAQMRAAGEVQQTRSGAGILCWLAPPVQVSLPDGRTLLLGQDGARAPSASDDGLYPSGSAPEARVLTDYLGPPAYRFELRALGVANWRYVSPEDLAGCMPELHASEQSPGGTASLGLEAWIRTPRFEATVRTPQFDALPSQVRRALALVGHPLDDALVTWSLSPTLAAELEAWVGRSDTGAAEDDDEADTDQQRVIEAPGWYRLVVEAGPGSGKTRVACGRVARLINGGTSATRIFMISFTQAAVGELRTRIGGFLEDPGMAGDVQISTLDSLAGGFRNGFGQDGPPTGFEAGIAEALGLLTSGDRGLISYLGALEHVVIDEAQDLTGDRRALVEALVRSLSSSCGVTLFEDPDQAIYGWASDGSERLSTRLLAASEPAFSRVTLERDYRTRDSKLRQLKLELRSVLRNGLEPTATYNAVRLAIEAAAEPSSILTHPSSIPRSTLVLFRGRAELLSAAARFWRDGVPVRVRLTRRGKSATGWIGALFRAAEATSISRDAFDLLWRDLWPRPGALSADDAWNTLRAIAGAGSRGGIDLLRLCRLTASPSPPNSVALSSTGRTGPVLSTIHGSKGQEAEHVVLALPRAGGEATLEEARILFVAATRARTSLSVAAARPIFAEAIGGRLWSRWRDVHARIEVGVDGDVDVVRTAFPTDEAPPITEARQRALWTVADTPVAVRAVCRGGIWNLIADGGTFDGQCLGFLSAHLSANLREIGRVRHGGALPGSTLRGLFVVGSRTVALETTGHAVRFGLAPVVAGLASVYFNPATAQSPAGVAG